MVALVAKTGEAHMALRAVEGSFSGVGPHVDLKVSLL
jgi:hypothetical protein